MQNKVKHERKNIYILGISTHHTATATLIKNGIVVASVSEERFNGVKSFNGFPKAAIDWCLAIEEITGKDLTYVTMPYRQRPNYFSLSKKEDLEFSSQARMIITKVGTGIREFFRTARFFIPQLQPVSRFMYRMLAGTLGEYYTKKQINVIAEYLQIDKEKVVPFDHHLSHASAAYYASPYNNEKALVFTLDAEGDSASGSISVFNSKEIKVLSKIPREYSFGYIYGSVTQFLGMKPHEHEYKVMGLAPYAKYEDVRKVYEKIQDSIILDPKNKFLFTMPIHAQDYSRFLKSSLSRNRFDHVAGAVQLLLEERVVEWIQAAVSKTGISTVILSGGVFMNVKLNKKIADLKEVKNFFVLPSCGDESAPLGSCYLGLREFVGGKRTPLFISPIKTLYWGPAYTDDEVEDALKSTRSFRKYMVKKVDDIEKETARLLARGHIVARLRGGMEFGARALGNRSILADPRNVEAIRIINEQVKNRDFWMPFAASILREKANKYIVNPKHIESPYMMMTFDTTEKGKKEIRAGIHQYDFTTRPQMVSKNQNVAYHRLLSEFERITGVSGLLNTSFNLHGYPIVLGPREALWVFEQSGLTHLTLENYLVVKRN